MNGNLYQNPTFPGAINNYEDKSDNLIYNNSSFKEEESLIKNVINSKIKVYVSYKNDSSWQNKAFEGTGVEVDKEYFLIKNDNNREYILLKIKDINYIEFEKSKK